MLFLMVILVVSSDCEVFSENVIEVDDILSADFMPGRLLVLENPRQADLNEYENATSADDGSVNAALSTMGYHRSMMNEYLCRNFVAEQIVSEMSLSKIQKRVGHEVNGNNVSKKKHVVGLELLQDEGSSAYKDWLSKACVTNEQLDAWRLSALPLPRILFKDKETASTYILIRSTALEDIYRHYATPQNRDTAEVYGEDHDDDEEDYSNHLVGYAYAQQPVAPSKLGYSDSGYYPSVDTSSYAGTTGHGGYTYSSYGNTGVSGYAGGGGGHSSYGSPPKYHGAVSSGGKEHDLADLFDIAITALAYLSFGMFIVHVIMCISMTNNQGTTTTAMMPMSMSPTAMEPTGMMPSTENSAPGSTSTGGGDDSDSGTAADGGGDSPENNNDVGDGESTEGDGENEAEGDGMVEENGGDGGDGDGDGGGTDDTDADGGNQMETDDNGDAATATGGGSTGSEDSSGDMDSGDATGDDDAGDGDADGDNDAGDGGDGGDDEVVDERDQFNIRFRRDIPTVTQPNNIALNELAKRVLSSIEAAFLAAQDNGECLRKNLCENNKYSRTLESSSKIWIPVWSLGMSWLSGKLIHAAPLSVSTLDSIKASVLGLGNANCEIIYQKCDLISQRSLRKRRRRRRNA